VSGEERFYRRASDVVDEVVEARMWLGLHFRSADEDGADIGRQIANQLRRKFFTRQSSSNERSTTPTESLQTQSTVRRWPAGLTRKPYHPSLATAIVPS
jgi:hypothetical protein